MRVAICQPTLAAYRLPLYERLGALPDVELTLYAGSTEGSLEGFHSGKSFEVISAPVHIYAGGLRVQFGQVSPLIRRRFDLLISTWDIRYLTVTPSVALARSMGIPVVLWGHGYSKNPHWLTDAARNMLGRLADGVLLYTRSVAARLVEEAHFSKERVFVAPNALDQSPIQAARQYWLDRPDALDEFRRAHGLDPARTILFISRLEPGNRIDMLLAAAELLSRELPDLKVVIIGDGPERDRLHQLACSLGIQSRTIFAGRIYDESRLAPWMLSSALFCYPINVGLSLLHAFGYGLPAVTSDNRMAQNPEIEALVPDGNGLEYRDGDLQDMVRQCARILRDPDLRLRLAESALHTAVQLYSMDQMVDGFQQVFRWANSYRARRGSAGRAL
jgi:glycosyltransferase involved in cell wall biosynthesis